MVKKIFALDAAINNKNNQKGKIMDPRNKVIPMGTPVTVYYFEGPPNKTFMDHPYFFEDSKIQGHWDGKVAVAPISKSVDAYVVKPSDIKDR